jgi:CheY-like chemotaxis protein
MRKILEILVEQLAEFFSLRHFAIFQLNPLGLELDLTHSSGFKDGSTAILTGLKAEQGILRRLVDTGIPQVVNDIRETETSLSSLAEEEGLESMICVPIFSRDELWGLLAAFSREKSRFKEEDGRIITLFGGQIGQLFEHLSQSIRDNLDEVLVPILGSIELMNLRYSDKGTISTSEVLEAQNRFRRRVLSYIAGLEQGSLEEITGQEEARREGIKLPSGEELSVEEVITIKGDENPTPNTKKVLVIDDQPIVTDLLVSVLERMNYQARVASCGKEGLEMFEKDRFDLVITDLGMPDISGWEVSQAVKQKRPNVPVVVITGWGVDPDPNKVRDSKVDLIITKPFEVEQLEKTIRDLVER